MPFNLIKKYPELLELLHLTEPQRLESLNGILKKDIIDNDALNFRTKRIRPIKGEEPDLGIVLRHLVTEDVEVERDGRIFKSRVFEMDRAQRVHWIRNHLEELNPDKVLVFSVEERDRRKRKDRVRTYLFDEAEEYVIVLDPQRSKKDYFLVTAYYLNESYGKKKMLKLWKKRLDKIH